MAAGGMVADERITLVDIDTGARLETYLIGGGRGSGVVGVNDAAAHRVHPGDKVIIMSFGLMDESEVHGHRPRVVHVDDGNRIIALGSHSDEAIAEGVQSPPLARIRSA